MRSAQKSNRSRGRGNRKSGGGGGNNINRVFDSAGPEGKVRGTPQQIIDKYLTLARDAQTSGDRVAAENFLQHAEHYQRILIQAAATQEQARRDQSDSGQDRGSDNGSDNGSDDRDYSRDQDDGSDDIGGMATFDSGEGSSTLLVDADDQPAPPPRRNGDGRRRKPKVQAEQPDPQDGAAEAKAEG